LKKCSNRLIFHTFWLVICKIDADPDPVPGTAYHSDADPDADPDFYLMRIRILPAADADPGYQNDADPDPQHCPSPPFNELHQVRYPVTLVLIFHSTATFLLLLQ
jgi:hypothetical protein